MEGRPSMTAASARRILVSNAGLLVGSLTGMAAGIYGALVGALLGLMLDAALVEHRVRSWLSDPRRGAPDEPLPGLAAALALAVPDAADREPQGGGTTHRAFLLALVDRHLARRGRTRFLLGLLLHRPRPRALLALVLARHEPDQAPDRAALARWMALEGTDEAREFLAEAVWGQEAERSDRLGWERERELAAGLADAGLGIELIRRERERSFPGWRSPWEVLGLEPGAPPEALRRAWKQVSKRLHPDSGKAGSGEDGFREAREAYDLLAATAGPDDSSEAADYEGLNPVRSS